MADIFDEVSEDLRKDQYKQIWFKYKKFIISFVLILVMSVVAFKFIESYQEKKKIEIATLYFDGLQEIKNKNYEKAEVLYKKLIKDADNGNKMIGVVAQKDFDIELPETTDLHEVGTIATILKMLKMPDGNILL